MSQSKMWTLFVHIFDMNFHVIRPELSNDLLDAEDAREVHFFDDSTGDLSAAVRLKSRFERAGYRRVTVRKPSPHHPVWLVKAITHTGHHFSKDSEFLVHVIDLLWQAGFGVLKRDVIAQRSGERTVVTFMFTPESVAGSWKRR